jgi:hypothetical protein
MSMKVVLAIACLFLFTTVAHADSNQTWDISGTADFNINGQALDATFSYTLVGSPSNLDNVTISDLQFSSSGAFGAFTLLHACPFCEWSNNGSLSGVVFEAALTCLGTNCPIELNVFDPTYPFAVFVPYSEKTQIIDGPVPEPAAISLLLIGLAALGLRFRLGWALRPNR